MTPQERKKKLEEELKSLEETTPKNDLSSSMINLENDMPGFGNAVDYNYDGEITDVFNESKDIIESLVELYLGEFPEILEHPYIQVKKKEDARAYATTLFLDKMSKKLFIKMMKQIDEGDNQARMYEVANNIAKEIRESAKDARTSRTQIESLYKDLREELKEDMHISSTSDDEDAGDIIDQESLNEKINNIIKEKANKKKR